MKICNKCKNSKDENEFYKSKASNNGLSSICKPCYLSKYYTPTPNKKVCKECNISLSKDTGRSSGHKRKNGSIIYANTCKNCFNSYLKEYNKNRRKDNIQVKLYESIKANINKRIHNSKSSKINKHLGCTLTEYKLYLEQQFNNNMDWENYGNYWEIDHIIPLSKNGSFHYTNTQPLTITENRKKSNKL
jgi:hypothetical protein